MRNYLALLILLMPLLADAQSVHHLALADSNRWGNYSMANTGVWSMRTASDSEPVPVRINKMDSIRALPQWVGYGTFETTIEVDSIISSRPWVLGYYSPGGVRIWLNNEMVLQTGNPSVHPDEEILGRFLTIVDRQVHLREGLNTIRIEYSEHTVPFRFVTGLGNVRLGIIDLYLKKPFPDGYQRRHRAFIFGGTMLILLTLILLHGFLSLQFRNEYHHSVMLTIGFIALHAFTTMADSMINWTFAYAPILELSYATAFIFVLYYFSLSLRHYYRLPLNTVTMRVILAISMAVALYGAFNSRAYLHILHPALCILTIAYGVWTMVEAKRASKENEIAIILIGFLVTMGGALAYSLFYLAFGIQNDVLLILSALSAYTGIPIALTFNIAKSYSGLFKTMELKVIERTAQLHQANEYKSRFFANISHEFRTPLTIARGLTDRLAVRHPSNQSINDDIRPIQRNLRRLSDMVNQIVDLTKADYDQMTLHPKHYLADSIVSLSVESFRSLTEQRNQTLTYESESQGAIVYADRAKFEIIINNLISNAIKFTPEGGSIHIRTTATQDRFALTVEDTGRGIPPEEHDAIFERFHRIKQNNEDYVEGMGIGLELSRTLSRLHNGDIRIKPTESGIGSIFEFEMPLSSSPYPEDILQDMNKEFGSMKPTMEQNPSAEHHILLVEDNNDMATYIQQVLNETGVVKRAHNGRDALDLLNTFQPDLIITDLMMPKMGGAALVDELMKHPEWRHIPVVVLTAKSLEADKLDLLRIGVVDYITKPFSVDELQFKCRNLIALAKKRIKARIVLGSGATLPDREQLSPKAAEWIKSNIKDQSLSVDGLADYLNMSRRTLYRQLEVETGMTTAEFIREIRLQTARSILQKSPSATMESIAAAVGYTNARTFRNVYRERFGVHPLDDVPSA